MRRLTCFLLALVMIVSLFPGVPHAHAAEAPSLVITNAEGEETDTFVVGEPIYVTASSNVAEDWVGFYDLKYPDASTFWYYVSDADHENGGTYNVYDGEPNTGWAGWMMEPNAEDEVRYEIRLVESGLKKTVTIVAPEDSTYSSLEVKESTVTAGESIVVNATSYKQYAWVALYSGTKTASDTFGGDYSTYKYVTGQNGVDMEFPVYSAGEYTVVLFADGGYTVDKVVNVTVEEPQEELPPILTTDKTTYAYGEAINVTVDASAYASTGKDWVGIFNKGAVPSNTVNSYFWYYPAEMGATFNVLNGTTNSLGNCVPGEYSVILLANDGYSVITSVEITIIGEEASRTVVEPTCDEEGYTLVTYTDGSTEKVDIVPALGHDYGDWTYNAESKTHSKACKRDASHVATENCTFDEGAVTKEPTETETGVKTFTCTVCSGTYTEEIPATGAVETGRETVAPTCTEEGYTLITYTDGTTEKVDIVPALGHGWTDWTHVDLTRTHIRACQRENCEVTETENCVLEHESVSGSQLKYTCSVCGDYAEDILWTDKAEYESGEDIIVTVNPNYDFGATDWIGLYKAGEAPSPTGVTSIRWDYVDKFEGGMNIFLTNWHDRPTEDVDNHLTAGEYWLYLCKNDGYEIVTHISFMVTAVEVSRETTPPTCEEDGYVTAYYSDGTSKVVVTAEEDPSLKATGHAWGDWVYDGEEKQTHTHTCTVCEEDTETEACQWDEGVVTKEATETEDGLMTFTCTVCGGTKTKAISTKVVDRTETVEATCEEAGYVRTWYTDGTYTDEPIPPKGHAYGEWIFDSEAHTHTKTCANDVSHTVTEDCSFDVVVSGNSATHTCTVCGGSYSTGILNTNKTNYTHGEEIIVTIFADVGPDAWVGLYGKGESANPNMGNGKVSYYWCWASDKVGTPFNMLADGHYNTDRGETLGSGEYVLRLFADSGYDNIVAEAEITIIKAEVSRTVVEPTCDEDGYTLVTYTDGSTEKVDIVAALGHDYGDWTYNAESKTHSKACKRDASHVATENCTFDEGAVTKEPTETETGVKTFTCTVCSGTYTEEIPATGAVETGRETVAPTCTEEGYTLITYSDGTTEKVDIVPALGHDIEGVAWTGIDVGNHGKICKRCEEVAETETHSMTGRIENGVTYHTCSVCGYVHEVVILATDKAEYKFGEPIIVTVNGEAYAANSNDWVGLYKKGEQFNPDIGGSYSIYWYWISDGGATEDINWRTNPAVRNENGRDGEFVGGEYTVALLTENGGNWYYEITSVDIVITAVATKTEVVEPTCTEAGYTYIEYNDGTTETVPGEPALGHAYPDAWTCNNDGKSHSKVCANDASHVITENCTWDEGVVTKEPTTEESGVRTYTCSVCEGTKEEIIPALTVEEVKRETVAPTCTEDGYTLVTYSDGTTQKIDIVPALGHDWGDWTHVERTRTHTHQCKREDCGVTETEDCVLEYEGLRGSQVECNCRTCGDYFEDLFWTDKAEYESGEDIIVTVNPNYDFGATDWIGLYKAGEAPSPTGVTSIRWDYVDKFEGGMNIFLTNWHDRPTEDVDNHLTAGEYWLYLCKNDGYEIVTHISFMVTAVEVSRETTPPTCEEDGYVTAYYSDGTSKVVVTAEEDPSLKATGHAWGDWVYDGEEKQTHTHTCTVCEEDTETEACQWDEGVVTKEATETEDGLMTFTCTVCGGTKTKVITTKTVDHTETVEATCEEAGYIRTWYTDGTYTDELLPPKGHAYGEWVFDSQTRSHTKTCANDASHTITEDCSFDVVVSGNSATYTCSVCDGSYVTGLLNTNKTTYALGEEIIVTVLADVGPEAWVGLYGKGEAANPNVGNGRVSYYWCWTSDKVGTPFNMLADGHYNTDRNEALGNGEYVLRLFADGGYDKIVAEVEITIFTDISGNEYKLKVNGEFVEDGTELSFLVGEEVIVIPVVEGEIGYGWMGIYSAKYNCDTVFSPSTPSDWYAYFTDVNNQTVSLNTAVDFGPGDYTVVLFADGGYGSPQLAVNFRVRKAVVSYEVLREATCTIPGSAKILYEGDTEYTFEPIPALGHDWSFNAETKSHVCQREACGISEPCEFSTVTDEEGNVTHTCSVCHGTYTEEKEPDDEEEETEGALLRLAGANRVLTSLQAADMLMKERNVEKLDAVILASAMNFPDALSGSYLAAVKNAPILLTAKGYEESVNAFITENLAEGGTVYVLGGEAAVPAALLEGLTGVQRVAGETRFETNLEILKEAGVTGNEILVCTALNFPDSLSAAAVGKPILLVGSKLTAEQEAYLQLLGEKNFYIIGGTSAISKSVEYALQSYGGTIRIAGENRYDTSALIAQRFFPEAEAVVLAYGRNYPDGLCGGALAAAMGAPVILVEDAFIDHAVDYVQGKEIQSGYVLGGTGLLSDASVRTIWALAEDAEIAVYSK